MKKIAFMLMAVMAYGTLSAQFAGIQNNQEQPLPDGFKPASTNTFLSQYPAVNPQTRQATFRVVAPYAQNVTLQLSGKHAMTKDEKGVWWYTTTPLVVGFHYYAAKPTLAATGSPQASKYRKDRKEIITGSIRTSRMEKFVHCSIGPT
jgi:hypothetical protein